VKLHFFSKIEFEAAIPKVKEPKKDSRRIWAIFSLDFPGSKVIQRRPHQRNPLRLRLQLIALVKYGEMLQETMKHMKQLNQPADLVPFTAILHGQDVQLLRTEGCHSSKNGYAERCHVASPCHNAAEKARTSSEESTS